MPDSTAQPDTTIQVDFSRLTSAGFGTVYGPAAAGLQTGQIIFITDDEADTIRAEVLEVRGDSAEIRARWDDVLHRA